MLNKYEQTTAWLFQQFPSFQNTGAQAYKPGLDNVVKLLNYFENPDKKLNFIHIAGTNGKGSTASFTASILVELGEKVGLFTSPHIFDFRERIRVNGKKIPEEDVISFCAKIQSLNLDFEPSFFEISFVLSLVHFSRENCSICVIETGLGGRLDATNCITPKISVITNIGMDHMQFLGNTIQEIALEKGGIIKEKCPIVIGKTQLEIKDLFIKIAKEKESQITFADESDYSKISVFPAYQKENLRTALKALVLLSFPINDELVQKSIHFLSKNSGLFARMTIISEKPRIILDVSHNEDGIKTTLESLKLNSNGKLSVILGCSNDKNIQSHMNLFPKNSVINLCVFKNERSRTIEDYVNIKATNSKVEVIYENINLAIETEKKKLSPEDTLLVTGSFFLIADYHSEEASS